MNIENDPYLQYGIEIPSPEGEIDISPLHERIDRVVKAIRNDQTKQASANIGHFPRVANPEAVSNKVWLSLIMNLRSHGIEEAENTFEAPSTISGAIDLYDPESERTLRVIECIGPMATQTGFIDDASNFSVLSHRLPETSESVREDLLTLAD
ncbi:MAG: hypothetical protein U5L95_01060 [Candidatus Saccharibacteria bacterium]|nr:hypothetical protein [Candidatus Saccharibacteria bacterium]